MRSLLTLLFAASFFSAIAQTNTFPLYSSGSYSGGGSGDNTGIINAQLKLQATSGYIRVPHISADGGVSTVYNFETGKNVYWGEPSDAGLYLFRGRNLVITEGKLGIGTTSPGAKLHLSAASRNEALRVYMDGNTTNYLSLGQGSGGAVIDPIGTGLLFLGYDQPANVVMCYGGGNVGIGSNSPSFRFHIRGSNANSDAMTLGSTTTGNFALTSADGGAYGLFGGVSNTGRAWLQAGRYDSNLAYDLSLQTAGGNVGIGTTSPSHKLSVGGSNASVATWASALFSDGLAITSNSNSSATYLYNQSQTGLHGLNAYDYSSNTYIPLYLGWGGNSVLIAKDGGNVGIGTTNPGSYKLAVEGKIGAREVNVTAANPWPDYVFDKNYKLPSLEEIKNYIDQNQHLPEVPSAKEIEKKGVNVGEMNALLLKKIEELTLYVIELKKENESTKAQTKAQMESMQSEINRLKK